MTYLDEHSRPMPPLAGDETTPEWHVPGDHH
jgi:hypothetical protein